MSRPVCRLRFTLFKWPFSYTLHIHAHLVPVTALYRRFPQFHSKLVYMLKMLFDRDTNKCFDKDITKYLDKYHNKRINKYKDKLINKHENKRIDKYKTKYILQPLLQAQPLHHSHAILAQPQHRLDAAPTPPPHRSNPC